MLKRLNKRITAYVMAAAIIIYTSVGILSYFTAARSIRNSSLTLADSFSGEVSKYVSDNISDICENMYNDYLHSLIAGTLESGSKKDTELLAEINKRIANSTPGVINSCVYSPVGDLLTSSADSNSMSFSERMSYNEYRAVNNGTVEVHLIKKSNSYDNFIQATLPIYSNSGCIAYYFTDISVEYIYGLLFTYLNPIDSGSEYLLCSPDFAVSDNDNISKEYIDTANKYVMSTFGNSSRAVFTDDKQYVVCESSVYSDIKLVMISSAASSNRAVKHLAMWISGIVLALTLLTALIITSLSRNLISPIRRLLDRMKGNNDTSDTNGI